MTVYNKLYPYQRKIIDESYRNASALFMDMGTGKTITSLAMFEKSKSTKILIICLVSKLHDWKDELNSNFPIMTVSILNKGTKTNIDILNQQHDAIIVNYESAWRLEKQLLKLITDDWYIIVDESHKIKNTKSKIGKFASKLALKTKHKTILTGTPQNNGYLDYFNQLRFLGMINMSEKDFKSRYCVFETQTFGGKYFNVLKGYKNTQELDNLINERCVFFKREVSDELIPSEIKVTIQKHKSIDKMKKTMVHGDIIADNSAALRVYLRQLCSGFIKQEEVSQEKYQWVKDFMDSYDKRIVLFVNFNMEVKQLSELCNSLGRPFSIYNGESKDLTAFKENDNGVAICNYASAAMGLNDLVLASTCIMYSPTEDYILFEQSKKRIDRIGQTVKPLLYFLETEKSVEVAIYKSLSEGKNFDERMFENYLKENA